MKAPIAQAAPETAFAPGCSFLFCFWGLEIAKCVLKNSDFDWFKI
jgi:hypothetical protein